MLTGRKQRNQKRTRRSSLYYAYILKCADGTLYTGTTTDLKRRVFEHNYTKRGARYTRSRRPIKLESSEKFSNRSKALIREAEIKKLKKTYKISLILTGKRKRP